MFAAIDSPAIGMIDTTIEIYGSAWIDAGPFSPVTFDRYTLYWAFEGNFTWTLIEESTDTVHHAIIAEWNTDGMAEGDYDLRLTIWNSAGDSLTAFKSVGLHQILCTKGDVNNDGTINVLDVVMTVNIILELVEPTPYQFCAADLDGDGEIDILDVMQIVEIILQNTHPQTGNRS